MGRVFIASAPRRELLWGAAGRLPVSSFGWFCPAFGGFENCRCLWLKPSVITRHTNVSRPVGSAIRLPPYRFTPHRPRASATTSVGHHCITPAKSAHHRCARGLFNTLHQPKHLDSEVSSNHQTRLGIKPFCAKNRSGKTLQRVRQAPTRSGSSTSSHPSTLSRFLRDRLTGFPDVQRARRQSDIWLRVR